MNARSCAPQWHVVYTMPKAERKVATSVVGMGIESYLPLTKVVRQWSDRKKKVEVPLFPNYVFVKVNDRMRSSLYSIKPLLKFVSVDRRPVVISDSVITTIQSLLHQGAEISDESYFEEGATVRVVHGQFAGLEGIVIKRCSKFRLLIRIEGIMKAVSF